MCQYRFTSPHPFWMVIRGVGTDQPVVEVRAIDTIGIFYPQIRLGDPCIKMCTAIKGRV